jgi:hypothetical protein
VNQISDFLNNPLVAPLYALLVITVIDMLLGVYRSIQQGVFDWGKLPQILDSTVLQKVIPLAGLGVASYFVTDGTAKAALEAAYLAGAVAALAGEVATLIQKVTGSFVATNLAQDKGTPVELTAMTTEEAYSPPPVPAYVAPPLAPQTEPVLPDVVRQRTSSFRTEPTISADKPK